jgi:DNA polymerase (family X)
MSIHNADIAAIFEEIAELLEIEGDNPFRIRAYRNAARELHALGVPAADMVGRGEDLTELPAIGDDLAAKIREIIATGRCATLEKLRARFPPTITTLLHLPGIGPKRVKTLYRALDIATIEQLERAACDGKIRALAGFGARTEAAILDAVRQHRKQTQRLRLAMAEQYAEPLVAYLRQARNLRDVIVAGSYRRSRETVGDLDILASTTSPSNIIEWFVRYEEVSRVIAQGKTRASVNLKSGLQVDLRVVPVESFGAALQYFTGSKAHSIAIRRLAQAHKLKINEYGVFRGKTRIAGDTEESVYRSVGLPWIAPELREDRGEIEAARDGRLPTLIELADLRGDLHAHTNATDGHHSLLQMAEAARARGFEYLAITEHSRRLTFVHGLDPRRLRKQMMEIDGINARLANIRLLKGIEVDILEDGNLDLPDAVLAECDLVIGAVHSQFKLPRRKQTDRILRAMDRPNFSILAHPAGRLIGSREAYDIDMPRIIRKARERGCFLELNAHPERLDLLDTHCQMAREEGVRVAISSDAHRVQDFDNLRFGVAQARRGWLEPDDVLNTRALAELLPLLRATLHRRA